MRQSDAAVMRAPDPTVVRPAMEHRIAHRRDDGGTGGEAPTGRDYPAHAAHHRAPSARTGPSQRAGAVAGSGSAAVLPVAASARLRARTIDWARSRPTP